MWKPVQLQGWGPGSVRINGVKAPAEKLQYWRDKVTQLISANSVDLLPAQEVGVGVPEPVTLFDEEGPCIIVLAKSTGDPNAFDQAANQGARIDGFSITGADHGGGLIVNGYAHYLEISNNRIFSNNGVYGGGIRIGHPTLTLETLVGTEYQDGFNDNIRIHNNHITQNSGLNGAGGGISLNTGTDDYQVTDNFISGNFGIGGGGGIGHLGLSNGGLIARNTILFNESFQQGLTVNGGGILIAGGSPLNGPGSCRAGRGIGDHQRQPDPGQCGRSRRRRRHPHPPGQRPGCGRQPRRSTHVVFGQYLQQHDRRQPGGPGRRRHIAAGQCTGQHRP